MPEPRLILFDIDCTLMRTAGAGMAALQRTLQEIWQIPLGSPLHGVQPDGQTDPKIVRALLQSFDLPSRHWDELEVRLLQAYPRFFAEELEQRRHQSRLEPGVVELLSELSHYSHACLGVLTGNIEATARMKLDFFQLNPRFPVGAFGSDSRERDELGPIALQRAQQHFAQSFSPRQTWIVGDTDKDIQAARALGARVLAVATGSYSRQQLEDCGPDVCCDDLSQTPWVLQTLLA